LRQPRYLTSGALALGAIVAMSITSAAGCGPIEYINQVSSKAASAVEAAKLAQADKYAPYEYTSAQEYLHKAREEAGYSEYQISIEYGHKSEEFANKARAIAVTRMSQPAPQPMTAPATPAKPAATESAEPATPPSPSRDASGTGGAPSSEDPQQKRPETE
jgi:hypothetical protein